MEAGQHRPVAILFYRQLKVKYFNLKFANIDPNITLSGIFSNYSTINRQTPIQNYWLARNKTGRIFLQFELIVYNFLIILLILMNTCTYFFLREKCIHLYILWHWKAFLNTSEHFVYLQGSFRDCSWFSRYPLPRFKGNWPWGFRHGCIPAKSRCPSEPLWVLAGIQYCAGRCVAMVPDDKSNRPWPHDFRAKWHTMAAPLQKNIHASQVQGQPLSL